MWLKKFFENVFNVGDKKSERNKSVVNKFYIKNRDQGVVNINQLTDLKIESPRGKKIKLLKS